MKFSSKMTKLVMMAAIALAVVSCGENNKQEAGKPANGNKSTENMVIRYVDADSLMAQYNLAKDFNESALKMQNDYDAYQTSQQKSIAALENEFKAKEQNNVYASNPQQAQVDQARYQKAMNEAQSRLADKQDKMQKAAQANQKELLDSIDNYLKVYAKEKGFDMILNKAATFYVDPKYDVTADVVKGLNKRYTKVADKKK